MAMPIRPVSRPPVRKEMKRGKAFEKSLAGETTLAAMFTLKVATTMVNIAMATNARLSKWPTRSTGSQMAFPKIIAVAEVMTTPMPANTVMVVGSATICPKACSRCECPKRVKSGMFKESVAQ